MRFDKIEHSRLLFSIDETIYRMKFLLSLSITMFLVACTPEKGKSGLQEFQIPVSQNSSLPYLVKGGDGSLYFSWVEKKDSSWVELKYSKLENGNWSQPKLIAKGNDWFVNWADYPMVAIDSEGNMMAHFLAKSSVGTYSYDVNIVRKKSGEDQWSEPIIPHKDGTPTEHGFATMLPKENGNFQIFWLDGRNTGGGDHRSHNGGAMTIRTAVMNMDGNLTEEAELDNRVCDCCQTTGANTNSGPVILYRDRSEMEIRDLSIVRKVNQIWTESAPVFLDNWNIEGCPVNGPRADAIGNNLGIAWYTASNNQPKVKVIFSEDGGVTFNQQILIDESSPLGRVDMAMIVENQGLVTWLATTDSKSVIYGKVVNADGSMKESFIISETKESRASGFPQLAIHDGYAYFAWTMPEEPDSSIQMARLSLDKLK